MSNTSWEFREDDLSAGATRDLIRLHLEGMHAHSPPGSVFALDFSGLKAPNVTVWSAWHGDKIAGIGALKDLGDGTGELKSMRTHPDFLRRGLAAALLEHIICAAQARGMSLLSLRRAAAPILNRPCLYTVDAVSPPERRLQITGEAPSISSCISHCAQPQGR